MIFISKHSTRKLREFNLNCYYFTWRFRFLAANKGKICMYNKIFLRILFSVSRKERVDNTFEERDNREERCRKTMRTLARRECRFEICLCAKLRACRERIYIYISEKLFFSSKLRGAGSNQCLYF